jgi:hypothetical protein
MKDYVLDKNGDRVYPGDYVETVSGARRRVTAIYGYHVCTSSGAWRRSEVRLAGRYHPYHHGGIDKRHPRYKYSTNSERKEQMGKAVLYVAVSVHEAQDYELIAAQINQSTHVFGQMASTDYSALKRRIEDRIRNNPSERYLILSGLTVAETTHPPVTFRSV